MQPSAGPPYFWLWFPAVLLGMWLGVGALLAEWAGWPALARRYPAPEGPPPAGPRVRGQVTSVGRTSDSGVTYFVPTAAGLYLSCNRLFRFRRPPVLVPWAAVRDAGEYQAYAQRLRTLDLGGVTTLRLRQAGWRQVAPFLAGGAPAAAPAR